MSGKWVISKERLLAERDKIDELLAEAGIGPVVTAHMTVQKRQLTAAVAALDAGLPVTEELLGSALWATLGRPGG